MQWRYSGLVHTCRIAQFLHRRRSLEWDQKSRKKRGVAGVILTLVVRELSISSLKEQFPDIDITKVNWKI